MYAVDDQSTAPLLLFAVHARVLVDAGPSPILGFGSPNPAAPDSNGYKFYGARVVLHGRQRAIEEASPKLSRFFATPIDR